MEPENYPKPEIPPDEYWEDDKWLSNNMTELAKQYPNMWVAVIKKEVVAAGYNLRKVIDIAKDIAGHEHFPVDFIERGMHAY